MLKSIFISYEGRPPSVIGGPEFLGAYLLLLFFITLSLFIKERNQRAKIFYAVSIALFLYVIVLSGSRAAYLGLLVGGLYFFLLYPKKIIALKIAAVLLVAFGAFTVYYFNSRVPEELPKLLRENKVINEIRPRLSINLFLADPRFSAWQVGLKSIKDAPILGWGPENFSVAFDRYYTPSLPQLSKAWGGWWDRAHNVLLETAVTEGIPAMLIYLSLFIVLFWQLQKSRAKEENRETIIIFHGIQATLIAYFADNFFTFDTFSSYIIFFLLVAYSMHLIYKNQQTAEIKNQTYKRKGKFATVILFFVLVIFLWQYNIAPFLLNLQINIAEYFVDNKNCAGAFKKMDEIIPQHSFLDSYSRLQYVSFIQKCAGINPNNSLAYAQKGVELLKDSVKIQPLYTRSWIFLGGFATIMANSEKDQTKKESLLNEADYYFKEAEKLSLNHQETILAEAKTEIVRGNYQGAKEDAEKCISLDSSLGDCYWTRALSEIYLKDFNNSQLDMLVAQSKRFDIGSVLALGQLVNAYSASENYIELSSTYEKLVTIDPKTAQFRSSLAFAYAQIGEYKKAREQAMIFLKLMPEAKSEVDVFLKALPY